MFQVNIDSSTNCDFLTSYSEFASYRIRFAPSLILRYAVVSGNKIIFEIFSKSQERSQKNKMGRWNVQTTLNISVQDITEAMRPSMEVNWDHIIMTSSILRVQGQRGEGRRNNVYHVYENGRKMFSVDGVYDDPTMLQGGSLFSVWNSTVIHFYCDSRYYYSLDQFI